MKYWTITHYGNHYDEVIYSCWEDAIKMAIKFNTNAGMKLWRVRKVVPVYLHS